MAAVTICSDFGAQKNKVWHCFHCFAIYSPWRDGTRCHDLYFLNVEHKPTFSLSTFTFIKKLFSSSSLSAIRVVSSAYLRLLIFLPARTVLPIKSSSALSLPPLQKNLNLKPLKGPLNPQPPISTQQMDLLPTAPEVRLPETRHHPLALPPPNREVMTTPPLHRPRP